jgi:hypothetical protein
MFRGPNGTGKGDKPRGMNISQKEFSERWDKIFNKKKKKDSKNGNRSK